MKHRDYLRAWLRRGAEARSALAGDGPQAEAFHAAAESAVECYRRGGRLYVAGNGGSAAQAQHLAAELVSRMGRAREPLPAESLTTDTSILTALANDYGYAEVFARQVGAKCGQADLFLALTTSGNSPNVVRALEECRRKGVASILFSARDGGKCRDLATHAVLVPSTDTAMIQEVHLALCHALCACVEDAIFPTSVKEAR